ncbi:MAG: N-acetyltransferase [Clostridia bacterium]|nr:N-acetyltransferase [Clostridia bacterium]
MQDRFFVVNLYDVIEELGEDKARAILSEFSCSKNSDVDTFLKKKAIMFSNQGTARTHLVYADRDGQKVLVGYYALAAKTLSIQMSGNKRLSQGLQRRLKKFMKYDERSGMHMMSALLIGQLGKNFANHADELITGDELLQIALKSVREVQKIAGGKVVYLECEDKPVLKNLYSNNGFVYFDKRMLDKDEGGLSGEYLLQYLKYM